MKKTAFLLLLTMSLVTSCASLLGIQYSYASFRAGSGMVRYTVFPDGNDLFLAVTLSSGQPLFFTENPVMTLQNFGGATITLKGTALGNSVALAGAESSTNYLSGQFKVEPEQVDFFRNGIRSVRITTVPTIHERSFYRDRIGRKLHKELLSGRGLLNGTIDTTILAR